jgi:hypothetical protein
MCASKFILLVGTSFWIEINHALFWKNLGHPCFVFDSDFDSSDSDTAMADNSSSMSKSAELIPVSPKSFLTFFLV